MSTVKYRATAALLHDGTPIQPGNEIGGAMFGEAQLEHLLLCGTLVPVEGAGPPRRSKKTQADDATQED